MTGPAVPATLAAAVRRATVRGFVAFTVVGAMVATAPRFPADDPGVPVPSADSTSVTAVAPGARGDAPAPTAADLVRAHDCWTSGEPAGAEIPGHVVVTSPGGHPRYAGAAAVGRALDQLFAGVDHDLLVHAFCR